MPNNTPPSLPTEVWLTIFNMVKMQFRGNISTCRLVCKTWKPLAESVIYKQVDMNDWIDKRYTLFSEHLSARPDLGQLVQEIILTSDVRKNVLLYPVLRCTPNLKIITGYWTHELVDQTFSNKSLLSLELQQLPDTSQNSQMLPTLLRYYKNTLTSFYICLLEDTKLKTLARYRLKNLVRLTIIDGKAFQNVKELENFIKGFGQVKELKLRIGQSTTYTHMNQDELKQWMMKNVEKNENIKTLSIEYSHDGLPYNAKTFRAAGPDWMEYLVYKCPNVEALNISSKENNTQHIIPPTFKHLKKFDVKSMKFYDMDVLKQFVNADANRNVHLVWKKDVTYMRPPFYLCMLSANNTKHTKVATFEITTNNHSQPDMDIQAIKSLFSAKNITHWTVAAYEDINSTIMNQISESNAKSLRLQGKHLCIEEGDHLQQAATIENLELVYMRKGSESIPWLSKSLPQLKHLTVWNCRFTDIEIAPSLQLTSLRLFVSYARSLSPEYHDAKRLLFHLSTTRYSKTHIFFAAPGKPIHMLTEQEHCNYIDPIIRIKCSTLQKLKVAIEHIKFTLEFDVQNGDIISASTGIENSINYTLVKECALLKSKYTQLEEKYARAKEYLSASQIELVEDI